MNIHSITLRYITAPLKEPFVTALNTVMTRESIILEVKDIDGNSGWGEVVAFSSPWYTEETITTCMYILKDYLIPLLEEHPINHPDQLQKIFAVVRGHHMAKAGLECAFWDLYAKQNNTPLYKLFGGTRNKIESGVVIASNDLYKAIEQIEKYKEDGYKRYKVKVNPQTAVSYVEKIRAAYPDLPLMVDANSSFTFEHLDVLKQLDSFRLMMIEQPLGHDDLMQHRALQKQIQTPICLDESITSVQSAINACAMESCQIVCVKMGRVGGWGAAVQIHDYCMKNNVKLWCGGMIEFGISKAHNAALATLEGFHIPGDISSSARFWHEDIIAPEIVVEKGMIVLSEKPGIGFDIHYPILDRLTRAKETYLFDKDYVD